MMRNDKFFEKLNIEKQPAYWKVLYNLLKEKKAFGTHF